MNILGVLMAVVVDLLSISDKKIDNFLQSTAAAT